MAENEVLVKTCNATMTVNQVADILGVTGEAIKKHVRELFPEAIKNGVATVLSEEQVYAIKKRMVPTTEVVGALTSLDIAEMTVKVIQYHKAEAERLREENAELKPKADFFDQVASSKTAISMRQVAAALNLPGWGRNKLFAFLREQGILDVNNLPYREYQDRGYFRVIEQKYVSPDGETHINFTTLVYQRGVDYIRRMIGNMAARVSA